MPAVLHDRYERLYAAQCDSGISLVELTIRYRLADSEFSTVVVGAAKHSEIEESVATAERGPLTVDLQDAIENVGFSYLYAAISGYDEEARSSTPVMHDEPSGKVSPSSLWTPLLRHPAN